MCALLKETLFMRKNDSVQLGFLTGGFVRRCRAPEWKRGVDKTVLWTVDGDSASSDVGIVRDKNIGKVLSRSVPQF